MCSSIRCATTSASVSLRERVAARRELGAQLLVVLDDAVEDDRDAPAAVVVRVGVLLAGPAVRGPARVPEADAWPSEPFSPAAANSASRLPTARTVVEAVVLDEGDARPSRSRGTPAA